MLNNLSILQSRMVKWGLGICTAIYIVVYPILLGMAFVCSMLALERSTETLVTRGVIVVTMAGLLLSIPVSIYLMWSMYFRNQLGKSLIFAGLPLYAYAVMLLIYGILDAFTRQ